MEFFFQDFRFVARVLRKSIGFSIISAVTLAMGIGATTAIYSLIEGVLLTPPPYSHPEQLVLLTAARLDGQSCSPELSALQWGEWQKETNSFAAMAGFGWTFNFLIQREGSAALEGMVVTPQYFRVLGVQPFLGRTFNDAEADAKSTTAVILGYELWQRRFRGDSNVLGKTLTISRQEQPLTVIGVMPPGLRFLPCPGEAQEPNYNVNNRVAFWIPASLKQAKPKDASWNVIARLRDGISLPTANATLATLAARQAKDEPDFEGISAKAQLLVTEMNREGRRVLFPLLGAAALFFLLASINVAGLMVARGLHRQHEYAVRLALGAGTLQVVGLVLMEGLFLGGIGGALAFGLATAILQLLKAFGSAAVPRLDAVSMNWAVLFFNIGVASVSGIFASLVAAWRVIRMNASLALKSSGPTTSPGRTERRLLGGVAAAQMAITVALLVGAGLLCRTVDKMARVRLGYDTDHILTLNVTSMELGNFFAFHEQALNRISALPGVRQAAFAWGVPLTGNRWVSAVKIGPEAASGRIKDIPRIVTRSVTPEYFELIGQPIRFGRNFPATHSSETNRIVMPTVAIVNDALATRYFAGMSPVGRSFRMLGREDKPIEIIGVVANARTDSVATEPEPEIYFCFWEAFPFTKHLLVRTSSDPRALALSVQRELHRIEPTASIAQIKTLARIREDSVAVYTFTRLLLVGFSVMALILTSVAIYGVLSLFIASRQREIAIRAAVGATPKRIFSLVLGEGIRLIAGGLVLGAALAITLARVLKSLLFGVPPLDPMTYVCVVGLFSGISLIVCWLPARRASRIHPVKVLHAE